MNSAEHDGNVVLLNIGADEYDEKIKSYKPPLHLIYHFDNPGTVAVGTRPNQEDPARVNVSGDIWQWMKGAAKIHWQDITLISPLKEAIKSYACWQIENNSWASGVHAYGCFKRIQDMLKDPGEWPWSSAKVLQILAALRSKNTFGNFKGFYLWAEDMKIPGFSSEIANRIRDLRCSEGPEPGAEAKRTRKHVLSFQEEILLRDALRSLVPYEHTPLPSTYDPNSLISQVEVNPLMGYGKDYRRNTGGGLHALTSMGVTPVKTVERGIHSDRTYRMGDIITAIDRYHIINKMNHLRANITTHLAFALGARPSQICSINESGFKTYADNDAAYYSIDIPSRKKRTESRTFKRRKFPPEIGLGQKIEQYISLKREAERKHILAKPKSADIPLFYSYPNGYGLISAAPIKPTRASAFSVKNFIQAFNKAAGVNRSAKELRANVAQRLADAGYSAQLIKEVLDHERLHHIKAYIQAALGLSEILEQALATHEAYNDHIIKLRGTKVIYKKDITDQTDVISGTVNHKLISGIGACRRKEDSAACEKEIVYSCYGCSQFRPFDDISIHEAVLKELRAEVAETIDATGTSEPTKLALTHQETIHNVMATIQVVREAIENE